MIFIGFLLFEFLVDPKIQFLLTNPKIPLKTQFLQRQKLAFSTFFPEEKVKTAVIPCDLSKEIEVLACPSRPGSEGVEKLFIFLKSSQSKQEIDLETWVYLDSQKNGFCFSFSETPLSLRLVKKSGAIFVEINLQAEALEEKGLILEAPEGFFVEKKPLLENGIKPPFESLFQGRFLGKDLLCKDGVYRLETESGSLFIKKGDLLVFEKTKWRRVDSFTDAKDDPLACIKKLSNMGLTIDAWDKDGKYFSKILTLQKEQEPSNRPTNWISEVRKRTKTKVSITISGKKILLRKGDWLVEKKGRWLVLRLDSQKENHLKQKTESEIFVFEDILEDKGDKKMVGFLYNPTRTKSKRMEFPFAGSKTKKTTNNQKNMYIPFTRKG